jgi:hypothetical protein
MVGNADIALSLFRVIGLTLPALGIFFSIVLGEKEDLKDKPGLSLSFFITALMLTLATLAIVWELDNTGRSLAIKGAFIFIYVAFLSLTSISYSIYLESRRESIFMPTKLKEKHPNLTKIITVVSALVASTAIVGGGIIKNIVVSLIGITILAIAAWLRIWEVSP